MSRTGIVKRVFGLTVCGLAGVGFAHSSLAEAAGMDVWNLPALQEQLDDATERRADLDAQDEAVHHRIVMKEHLIGELVAGRATLAETTDVFLELNRDTPAMATARRADPTADDREATARNVIGFAEVYTYPSAARRADALHRLADEYRAAFPGSPR